MKRFLAQALLKGVLVVLMAGAPAGMVLAAEEPEETRTSEKPDHDPETVLEKRAAHLDALFDSLAAAESATQAEPIEDMIWSVWRQSGSASVDLLMARGLEALAEGELDRSLTYFDQVVILAPAYPEGWNKRATIHFMRDDYGRSVADIAEVLRLEPRHFGALGGLALILTDTGDKESALEAYRQVLKVHPWLDGAREAADALRVDVEGRGI